jgi:Ca2+-transporting ATPase
VMPEQKLKIVQALKQNGEIVAMTGDGVNDAPSLKAAHIGIAMGERGTEVAREAASIVLLDDSFTSIATAISLGRRIYDNIRKAIGFVFAVHVPIAGLALLPLIAGLPPLLGPAHIAFLEMIIDPVCSLVFEAERAEPNVMQRPPRAPDEPLFSADLVLWGLGQGVVALLVVIAVFFVAVQRAMPESEIRAICFFALVTCVLGLVLVNRSFGASVFSALSHPTLAFGVVLTVVISVLTASLAIPAVADLFRFGPLHADDLAIVLTAATLMVMALEGIKMILPKPGHTTVPAVRSPRT